LRGLSDTNASLVKVDSGGALELRAGSVVTGNTSVSSSSSYGGGVYVGSNGTFTMSGGEISGNTASFWGGGVFVYSNGNFTKTGGGTVYGYAEGDAKSNTVQNSSGVVVSNRGHAVYVDSNPVKRRETTAGSTINLDSAVAGMAGRWE
jgi:hypothetical protein